jgi:hypothetical protein
MVGILKLIAYNNASLIHHPKPTKQVPDPSYCPDAEEGSENEGDLTW